MTGSLQEKKGNYYMVMAWTVVEGGKKKAKTKWFSTGLKAKGNKRKAEEMLNAKIVEYGNGLCDKDMLLSALILQWLENKKTDKKRPVRQNTWEGYRRNINKHIVPYFNDRLIKLKDVRNKDLETFYDDLLEHGLSGNTVRKIHTKYSDFRYIPIVSDIIQGMQDKLSIPCFLN